MHTHRMFGNGDAMKMMKGLWKKLYEREILRYLFFGACTTAVNLGIFMGLRQTGMSVPRANLLSIMAAVLFAFFVNRWLVFQSTAKGWKNIVFEFAGFTGMRFLTMLVEFYGGNMLIGWGRLPEWGSKLAIQIIVILLNYLISKCLVFGSPVKRQARERG